MADTAVTVAISGPTRGLAEAKLLALVVLTKPHVSRIVRYAWDDDSTL
jgi:hypothetical protein